MSDTVLKAKDMNYSTIPIQKSDYYIAKETEVRLVPEDAQRLDRIAEALEAICIELKYMR